MLPLVATLGRMTPTDSTPRRDPSPRLLRLGFVLLALAATAWATTYGPPGTMTSVALGAMAAYALAVVGLLVMATAYVLRLRR